LEFIEGRKLAAVEILEQRGGAWGGENAHK